MTVKHAFSLFIQDRRLNGCADGTLKNYHAILGAFIVENADAETNALAEILPPFLISMQDRNIARSTLSMYYRTVKAFCSFLANEGFVSEPIKVPTLKEPAPAISPLTIDDMRLIMKTLDRETFLGFRDWVFVRFMFDTGVRRGEIVGMTISDINLDDGFALIRGKGNKERHVPISKSVRRSLWELIKRSAPRRRMGVSAVFVSRNGDALGIRGANSVFRRLNRVGAVPNVKLHPHLIRHSFAVNFIEAGGDQFTLQKILGHSTLEMTSRYVTLARGSIQSIHERFSPTNLI